MGSQLDLLGLIKLNLSLNELGVFQCLPDCDRVGNSVGKFHYLIMKESWKTWVDFDVCAGETFQSFSRSAVNV